MKKQIFLMALAITALSVKGISQAATANTSHSVSLSLTNLMSISFTAGGAGVTMNFSTASDYTNGVTSANAATLSVQSNRNYNVTVKSSSANFSSTAATTMPVNNVLYVKESNQTTFTNLSTTDQTLLSNQTKGTATINVDYKATPGLNYDAGTYTATVVYTATQL